jgi:hypothetical protein
MRRAGRRGISSIYSAALTFIIATSLLSAAWSIVSWQAHYLSTKQKVVELEAQRGLERVEVRLEGNTLTLHNAGTLPARISHMVLLEGDAVRVFRSDILLAPRESRTIALTQPYTGAILVTRMGNTFSSQTREGVAVVTFDAIGIPPSLAGQPILVVDGVPYNYTQLPQTFTWQPGSRHNFTFTRGIYLGPETRVGWSTTRGLVNQREGQITAYRTGSVIAEYRTQYRLGLSDASMASISPSSPTNDGWYDAGTTVQATVPYTIPLTQDTRKSLTSYTLDGSTVPVPRRGSGSFTLSITMDRPRSLSFTYTTQYRVGVEASVVEAGPIPPATGYYRYTPNLVVNGGFESGLSPWACVGSTYASGCGFNGGAGITTSPVRTGAYSAYTVQGWVCSGGGCYSYFVGLAQAIPTQTTGIRLAGWIYVDAYSTNVNIYVWSFQASPCTPQPVPTTLSPLASWRSPSTQWQAFEYTITLPGTGCVEVVFQNTSRDASGYPVAAYIDDVSITPTSPVEGQVYTGDNMYRALGGGVEYHRRLEYLFPEGAVGRMLSLPLPPNHSLKQVYSQQGPLPSTAYLLSGGVLYIPEETIKVYGSSYLVVTWRGGSYGVALQDSPTGDGWYDEGARIWISSRQQGAYVFSQWAADPALYVESPTSPETYAVIGGPGRITARFTVEP